MYALMHCVPLPPPLLPFTVCVRSLCGVLRWAGVMLGGGCGCGCCAVCFVALALLFAAIVSALWRLLCCLLLLYVCGLGRN